MISFSSTQTTLLSKPAPITRSRPAWSASAVSSTTAGGFPSPAQIAFLPIDSATLTTAGPPVTTRIETPGWPIIVWAVLMVGCRTALSADGGPPLASTVRLNQRMTSSEQRLAPGWALNTTPLPDATMPMPLHTMVEVGLVDGVMAPITPNGAYSTSVRPSSPVQAVGVRSSVPGVRSAISTCFWILVSTRPMPVSSTVIREKFSACSMVIFRRAAMIVSRRAMDKAASRWWAHWAAATASSMVSWIPSSPPGPPSLRAGGPGTAETAPGGRKGVAAGEGGKPPVGLGVATGAKRSAASPRWTRPTTRRTISLMRV